MALKKVAESEEEKKRASKVLDVKSAKQNKKKIAKLTKGWILCRKCYRWTQCSCAGEDDKDD